MIPYEKTRPTATASKQNVRINRCTTPACSLDRILAALAWGGDAGEARRQQLIQEQQASLYQLLGSDSAIRLKEHQDKIPASAALPR